MTTKTQPPATVTDPEPGLPEPEWNVAYLFPRRGEWTEADYLRLPENGRVELSAGSLEILPMPTELHQLVIAFLYQQLDRFVRRRSLGVVLFAGLPIRLGEGKLRQPDLLFLRKENNHRRRGRYWDGADLVMEVVSEDDPARDYETKRTEYARAGIPEYWIVDPQAQRIRVLTLAGGEYRVHGDFGPGQEASSVLLPGFCVAVADLFAPPAG